MRATPLLLLTLLLPLAASTWTTPTDPQVEPSTPEDQGAWMWADPNQQALDRIYFSASLLPSPSAQSSVFVAYFGYWRDCNQDAFIGLGPGGPESYPAALGANPVVCPPASPYNSSGMAKEFLWISDGPGGDVVDPDARAWADWGRWGEAWLGWPKNAVTDTMHYDASITTGPRWRGHTVKPASPYGPDPVKLTAYAYVGSSPLTGQVGPGPAQLPGGVGTYGAEHCGTFTSGVFGNWQCDAALWPDPPRVGDPYHLRDTDCNEAVRGSGLC